LDTNAKDMIGLAIGENARKGPKNLKRSARGKYNRRKILLSHVLHQMEMAIDELLSQQGTVYKRDEAETLRAAIHSFRATAGLRQPQLEPLTQQELDDFMDMLENSKPWTPLSEVEMAELLAAIGLGEGDRDESEDEA
jgi:hypothetical protein